MSAIPCANPNCDTGNPGKSKCAACGTESYCGPACQKAHWSVHKGPCKAKTKSLSSSGSASPTSPLSPVVQPKALVPNSVPDHNGVIARLTASKNRTQTAFQSSDFEEAVTASNESIAIAKEIPDPGQSVELIQILLNLSSAHLQLGQSDLAESASLKCLEMAEKALILRNNHPHAIDMLQVALVNRGFMLLNVNKIDAAVAAATRALELAETIFGDNKMDPRFFKPLRCLGVSFTKQEKWEDAEKPLTRAYIIALKAGGACNGDTQTALEELIQVLMKKGDNAKAVQYSKKNFEALSQSELDRYHPGIGEAAARYASILATVKREAEAEPIMQRALEIREKAHGSQHQIVGMTLMAVANLRETMGNVGSETEGMLMRALEIFKRLDESEGGGMSGQHTVNAVNFIRRVRAKREGVSFTDEQEEAEKVIDAAAAPRTSSPKASAPQKVPQKPVTPKKDTSPLPRLDPKDLQSRLRLANEFFENAQYNKAEIMFQEAYLLLVEQFGPEHPHCVPAKRNVDIARQNAIMQLWHEVLVEECEGLSLSQGDDDDPNKPKKSSKEQQDELAKIFEQDPLLNPKGSSQEDAWLYKEPAKSTCTLC